MAFKAPKDDIDATDTDIELADIDTTSDTENEEFIIPDDAPQVERKGRYGLGGVSYDDAKAEAARKKMSAPGGDYYKSEVWEFDPEKNIKVYEGDCQDGDIDPAGRTVISIWGHPDTRRDKEGNEFTPFLSFRFSPDERLKKDSETDEYDFSYKQWISARSAYINHTGQKVKTVEDVIEFLIEENYFLTTSQSRDGSGGLFVFGVKADMRKNK